MSWIGSPLKIKPPYRPRLSYCPITNNGLLGRFYANPQWEGTPAFTEIDPWVDFYFHITPLPRPYTIEWVGSIHIPSDGHYLFGLSPSMNPPCGLIINKS